MDIKLTINSKPDLPGLEEEALRICQLAEAHQQFPVSSVAKLTARIAGQFGSSLFVEDWVALVLATAIRSTDDSTVIPQGVKEWGGRLSESHFFRSTAGLFALQAATRIATATRPPKPLPADEIRDYLLKTEIEAAAQRGGHKREIIELDPHLPVSPILRGATRPHERLALFRQLILEFRQAVEVSAALEKAGVSAGGPAGELADFLFELHENGFEHASHSPGARLVRLRKHLFRSSSELLNSAKHLPDLYFYLTEKIGGAGAHSVVEASVCDFGPGMVDGFLSSPAGLDHAQGDRGTLLEELVHEQLSSKINDPNAGRGTINALRAAGIMGAFVSLRTNEFWLTGSPLSSFGPIRLRHRPASGTLGRAAGTYWHFVYLQPFLGENRVEFRGPRA